MRAHGLRVRIALLDWAEASYDATSEAKRREMQNVHTLLGNLREVATKRLKQPEARP